VKWIWFKVPRCNCILLSKRRKKKIKDVFFQKWNVVVMNGSGGNKVVF